MRGRLLRLAYARLSLSRSGTILIRAPPVRRSLPFLGETSMSEPVIAQKAPYGVAVEAGKKYFWCSCGRSKKQPFCDGSHAGTGMSPLAYETKESKTLWFCGCKATKAQPLCDGAHNKL
jgi:CDGSH-type Zn-finger protein